MYVYNNYLHMYVKFSPVIANFATFQVRIVPKLLGKGSTL